MPKTNDLTSLAKKKTKVVKAFKPKVTVKPIHP